MTKYYKTTKESRKAIWELRTFYKIEDNVKMPRWLDYTGYWRKSVYDSTIIRDNAEEIDLSDILLERL